MAQSFQTCAHAILGISRLNRTKSFFFIVSRHFFSVPDVNKLWCKSDNPKHYRFKPGHFHTNWLWGLSAKYPCWGTHVGAFPFKARWDDITWKINERQPLGAGSEQDRGRFPPSRQTRFSLREGRFPCLFFALTRGEGEQTMISSRMQI